VAGVDIIGSRETATVAGTTWGLGAATFTAIFGEVTSLATLVATEAGALRKMNHALKEDQIVRLNMTTARTHTRNTGICTTRGGAPGVE